MLQALSSDHLAKGATAPGGTSFDGVRGRLEPAHHNICDFGGAMRKTTVRHAISAFITIGVLACLAGPGHAQFTLYDSFASGIIDPSNWEGVSVEGSFNAPTAEFIRSADTGALRLRLVSYGNDTSNSGNTVSRNGLQFRKLGTLGGPGFIIGIKAKVTVTDATVQDCAANPETGTAIRARAVLIGWFFNDGSSTGATDRTGNIAAGIQLTKEADGSNPIQAFLLKCTSATCDTFESPVGITTPTLTTTWSLNKPLILKMRWDQANGKFKFLVRDLETLAVETAVIDYLGIVADASVPVNGELKVIRVQNNVKNCTGDRKQVLIDALFDNINVQTKP